MWWRDRSLGVVDRMARVGPAAQRFGPSRRQLERLIR